MESDAAMNTVARDPVCGMTPDPEKARAKGNHLRYRDVDYFFCCAGCKAKFEAEPEKYIRPLSSPVHGGGVEKTLIHI
jgi:Cu+-exporting ATPase